MASKRRIAKLTAKADIPEDCYSSSPMLEICGGEIFVSGCTSLTEYGEEKISFESTMGTVSVIGQSLAVTSLEGGRMVIKGKLRSVTMGE